MVVASTAYARAMLYATVDRQENANALRVGITPTYARCEWLIELASNLRHHAHQNLQPLPTVAEKGHPILPLRTHFHTSIGASALPYFIRELYNLLRMRKVYIYLMHNGFIYYSHSKSVHKRQAAPD